MKHVHEQPDRHGIGRSLRGGDCDMMEAAEDHHNDDESPEDHCRKEEGSGNRSRRHPTPTRLAPQNVVTSTSSLPRR